MSVEKQDNRSIAYVMRTENACPPEERFLMIDAYFSESGIADCRQTVIKRFTNKEKNVQYQSFISWKKKENQLLLASFRAYADFTLPKTYNCVFNVRNPEEFVLVTVRIFQTLCNGWIPSDEVYHGNNQTYLLEFEPEIPGLIFRLHKEEAYQPTAPIDGLRLGICNQNDFPDIKTHLISKIKKPV